MIFWAMGASSSSGFFGAHGDLLAGREREELVRKLSEVDIEVPGRTEGRRSHHRERWCLVLYLRILAGHDRLTYPLSVEKVRLEDEPPDFILTTGERGRRVSLEVTEAGTERSQQAATELERRPPGTVLEDEGTLVPPGGSLTGRGWVGDELERQWASLVLSHIQRKTESLRRFTPADEYQLLVYDNTHFVFADLAVAGPFLVAKLSEWEAEARESKRRFSLISVLQDAELLFDARGEGACSGSSGSWWIAAFAGWHPGLCRGAPLGGLDDP